jgi:hypothetical protein
MTKEDELSIDPLKADIKKIIKEDESSLEHPSLSALL